MTLTSPSLSLSVRFQVKHAANLNLLLLKDVTIQPRFIEYFLIIYMSDSRCASEIIHFMLIFQFCFYIDTCFVPFESRRIDNIEMLSDISELHLTFCSRTNKLLSIFNVVRIAYPLLSLVCH